MNIDTYLKLLNYLTLQVVEINNNLILIGTQKEFSKELDIPLITLKRYFKLLREQNLIKTKKRGMYIVSKDIFKISKELKLK